MQVNYGARQKPRGQGICPDPGEWGLAPAGTRPARTVAAALVGGGTLLGREDRVELLVGRAQRLVLLGWSHQKTTLASYAMMMASSATALLLTLHDRGGWELFAFVAWAGVYLLLALAIARMERNHRVQGS